MSEDRELRLSALRGVSGLRSHEKTFADGMILELAAEFVPPAIAAFHEDSDDKEMQAAAIGAVLSLFHYRYIQAHGDELLPLLLSGLEHDDLRHEAIGGFFYLPASADRLAIAKLKEVVAAKLPSLALKYRTRASSLHNWKTMHK